MNSGIIGQMIWSVKIKEKRTSFVPTRLRRKGGGMIETGSINVTHPPLTPRGGDPMKYLIEISHNMTEDGGQRQESQEHDS